MTDRSRWVTFSTMPGPTSDMMIVALPNSGKVCPIYIGGCITEIVFLLAGMAQYHIKVLVIRAIFILFTALVYVSFVFLV